MKTDRELLRSYAREGSEEAFAEIVCRHVNLVYGAALRQLCGNVSLAHDVTQAVFTALAARANAHSGIRHVSAWLYSTTRFTVSHTVRAERRRQVREQKAQSMHALMETPESHEMPGVPPNLIDEVLEALDEGERDAILLRFFEGQSFSAIGMAMEVTEDAARMRVTRALEKTRMLFARRGITSSAAALGAALANQVVAAPANLAASASMAALAGSSAIAAHAGATVGLVTFMTTTKTIAWLASAAAIFALGYSGYQYHIASVRKKEVAQLTQDRDRLQEALGRSEQHAAELAQQAARADRKSSDLQGKLDGIRVTKPLTLKAVKAGQLPDEMVAQKMAEMKPLLEKGMPIKGVVIALVDGKPVQVPVQFVIGKETRIDATDDGVYVVTPTLNDDGSVKYAMVLLTKDPGGGPDQVETLPWVVQTPWGGFTLGIDGGRVIAFDPDKNGP